MSSHIPSAFLSFHSGSLKVQPTLGYANNSRKYFRHVFEEQQVKTVIGVYYQN